MSDTKLELNVPKMIKMIVTLESENGDLKAELNQLRVENERWRSDNLKQAILMRFKGLEPESSSLELIAEIEAAAVERAIAWARSQPDVYDGDDLLNYLHQWPAKRRGEHE